MFEQARFDSIHSSMINYGWWFIAVDEWECECCDKAISPHCFHTCKDIKIDVVLEDKPQSTQDSFP